jgi:hypothetical protein
MSYIHLVPELYSISDSISYRCDLVSIKRGRWRANENEDNHRTKQHNNLLTTGDYRAGNLVLTV